METRRDFLLTAVRVGALMAVQPLIQRIPLIETVTPMSQSFVLASTNLQEYLQGPQQFIAHRLILQGFIVGDDKGMNPWVIWDTHTLPMPLLLSGRDVLSVITYKVEER